MHLKRCKCEFACYPPDYHCDRSRKISRTSDIMSAISALRCSEFAWRQGGRGSVLLSEESARLLELAVVVLPFAPWRDPFRCVPMLYQLAVGDVEEIVEGGVDAI